jgi:hypothetical protein
MILSFTEVLFEIAVLLHCYVSVRFADSTHLQKLCIPQFCALEGFRETDIHC